MRYRRYLRERSSTSPKASSTRSDRFTRGPLQVKEIRAATKAIVRHIQRRAFPREHEALEMAKRDTIPGNPNKLVLCGKERIPHSMIGRQASGRKLSKAVGHSCALRKLNPILVDGVIRVGGRLERAPISFITKHPMILPPKHHVTELVIRHYHHQEGHSGARQVLSTIQQKFWIIRGPAAVRRILGKCVDCRKRNARPCEQIMAPLPAVLVTPFRPPFTSVGVDYFGPLIVKQRRSHVRRYGCIFACLVMRAVHIDIAHSLDTESFLGAFTRFTSRRGRPKELYSDNGTNFKGADAVLKEEFAKLATVDAQGRIRDHLRRNHTEWHFNPPVANHTGGVWERMIRSTRQILKALLKEQLVDDETLLTFMA